MKNLMLLSGLVAAIASPVLAMDPHDQYPSLDDMDVPPVDGWSGFYAGIYSGYAYGTAISAASVTDNIDVTGAMLGAAAGVNVQLDSFVLGVEGDLAWSGVEGSATCALDSGYDCTGSLDWLTTLRGRAGVAFDQVLIYATAGLAVAGATATVSPAPDGATGEYADTFVGWTVGVGGEMKVTDNVSVRAEYAYTDLGQRTAPAGTLTTTGDTDISATFQTVKLGVVYAF